MLTERPPIGTRVTFISSRSSVSSWHHQSGVVAHNPYGSREEDGYCWVRFDFSIGGQRHWHCRLEELDFEKLSSELQELRNRELHAMKFL